MHTSKVPLAQKSLEFLADLVHLCFLEDLVFHVDQPPHHFHARPKVHNKEKTNQNITNNKTHLGDFKCYIENIENYIHCLTGIPLTPSFPRGPSTPGSPSRPSRPTTPLGPGRPTGPYERNTTVYINISCRFCHDVRKTYSGASISRFTTWTIFAFCTLKKSVIQLRWILIDLK